jgi:cellulose synthase/poly-beta-1,6-N-acetylglucosamine synthase-like glycosyltransferase
MPKDLANGPQFLLLGFFATFYLIIEMILWSRFPLSDSIGTAVLLLISFLNIIPAGIFAFTVSSLLSYRWWSDLDEKNLLRKPPAMGEQRTAVLYTTYNDFMPDKADYDEREAREGGFKFFILDDSSDVATRRQVDEFTRSRECQVIRRANRSGYKAGAINNWTSRYGSGFDYIFILDSDSRAENRAISRCLDLARRDPKIAVVQSKTLSTTSYPSRYTLSSEAMQHAYMETVQRCMGKVGSSPFYGHNALLRIEALEGVGGLVEETNEDYKTLSLLSTRGYRSVYAESAVTWEDVPPDYLSSRKRSLRWARDAVSQLGLIKPATPPALAFFMFYGWVTYMSNLALLGLVSTLMFMSVSHVFSSASTELSGVLALGIIIFWPLAAMGVGRAALSKSKVSKAILWGSVYGMPMVFPISAQIVKTSASRLYRRLTVSLGKGFRRQEELIVTPSARSPARASGLWVPC